MKTTGRTLLILGAMASLTACADLLLDPESMAPIPHTPPFQATPLMRQLSCVVRVSDRSLSCGAAPDSASEGGPAAAPGNRLIGGQDRYVKLTSAGTSYDGGTQILQSTVTVQNLTSGRVGTQDGSTTAGVDVFFATDPTVTSGTGSVTVMSDGTDFYTASNQSYYRYNQILTSYEISQGRVWQFQVDPTVATFSFLVYVSAPMEDAAVPLLDAVWTGTTSSDWADPGNWEGSTVPDSTGVVTVLADAPGSAPQLSADAYVYHLRVASPKTLDLATHTLRVDGNIDVTGTVTGGTLHAAGSAALLGGNVSALRITGSATLQRQIVASGPISITGTLEAADRPLVVAIP